MENNSVKLLLLFSRPVVSDSLRPPQTTAHQASQSFTISWSLLKLMSIESVMPSNHLILCHLLLPSIFPRISVFSNKSALCIRWPKYWSFSISPSNESSGLISFMIDQLISLLSNGLSRVFSSTMVGKHQFFSTQPLRKGFAGSFLFLRSIVHLLNVSQCQSSQIGASF